MEQIYALCGNKKARTWDPNLFSAFRAAARAAAYTHQEHYQKPQPYPFFALLHRFIGYFRYKGKIRFNPRPITAEAPAEAAR